MKKGNLTAKLLVAFRVASMYVFLVVYNGVKKYIFYNPELPRGHCARLYSTLWHSVGKVQRELFASLGERLKPSEAAKALSSALSEILDS